MKGKKVKIGEFEYYESELYKDDSERETVEKMKEIDRERFISERIDELVKEKERASLLERKNNNKQRDARDDIKKRRNLRKFKEDSESGEAESNSDSEYDDKRSGKSSPSQSDSSSLSIDLSDNEDRKKREALSISDIEKMKITRNFVEKYWEIPVFDKKIEGCFVKVNINAKNGYLLAQIKSITEKETKYTMDHKTCNKYLLVVHATQEKAIPFNILSNSSITEVEYRTWKERMEKYNLTLPTPINVKVCNENIDRIKNFKYSEKELNTMIEMKKSKKILNQDKNMNITYELSLLNEEYASARMKYDETKDHTYSTRMAELTPNIEKLTKMQKEREREDFLKGEDDRINNINKRNQQKQKVNDMQNSLLNKKRKDNFTSNPYKRRDCNPINLFDSGYLHKNEIKNENKCEEDLIEFKMDVKKTVSDLYQGRKMKIDEIVEKSRIYVEEIENRLNKNHIDNSNDESRFFSLLKFDREYLRELVNKNNNIYKSKPDVKIIHLDQIEY